MNVVMPTAMVTMHQSKEQSDSSRKTAQRGIRVWKALSKFPLAVDNAKAILAVATNKNDSDGEDTKLIKVRKTQVVKQKSCLYQILTICLYLLSTGKTSLKSGATKKFKRRILPKP